MTKDLTDGLVLDYDPRSNQDYANDLTITVTGSPSKTVNQLNHLNSAYTFTGVTGKYLDSNEQTKFNWGTTNNDFTLIAWINADASDNSEGHIISKYYSYGWFIAINGGKVAARIKKNGGTSLNITGSTDIKGGWHMVAAVFDRSANCTLYVDGVSDGSGSISSVSGDACDTPYNLIIGGEAGPIPTTYVPFNGDVGNCKVYDRILTNGELTQLYNDVKHNYQGLFDGLVAGYDFKKDAKDFSGNENDGTVTGAIITTNQFGLIGAYDFDGTNDYIQSTLSSGLSSSFTFNCWINSDNVGKNGGLMRSHVASYSNYWTLLNQRSTGVIRFNLYDGTNNPVVDSTTVLTTGTWYMVTGVRDVPNDKLHIYINGVWEASVTDSTTSTPTYSDFFIGELRAISTWYFDGRIAYPIIIENACSASKIQQLYDLTNKDFIYPLPQRIIGGITE